MRIVIVIRSLVVGGAERQSIELARALSRRGHSVLFCTMSNDGPFADSVARSGLDHHRLGHDGPRNFIRTGLRLRKLIQEFSPDVVYSFMSVSNILCAFSLPQEFRKRLVWGVRASWTDLPQYGWFPRAVLRVERWLANRPRLVIANSASGAKYQIRTGFPEHTMRVVENSIDCVQFSWRAEWRRDYRARHQVPDARKIIVIVARIDPIKGYETFLSAAAQITEVKKEAVEFWCVGGGDLNLLNLLKAQAESLGIANRVKWLGEIKDTNEVVAILCAGDVSVSASIAEGFPNAVAEAMACGLRVVGTDVGDTCRIIGRSGKCVAVDDPSSMSVAVLAELDRAPNDRSEVRQDYLSRFEPQSLLERHEALLAEVARGGIQ